MTFLAALRAAILIGALGSLLLAERLRPVAPRQGGLGRVAKNFALAAGNGALSPLVVVPLTVLAASSSPIDRSAVLEGPLGLLLDLLLLDLWIYWWHRANHETPFLWRFHEVHHLDRFLDVSSSVRFHFGEILMSAAVRAAFVWLTGISVAAVLVFDLLVTLNAAFHHSNVRLPARAEALLRRLIVTPSHHWVHHHRRRRDTDSNYATILTIWDRLFRTWNMHARTPQMEIGTEGRPERGLGGLLINPISRRDETGSSPAR